MKSSSTDKSAKQPVQTLRTVLFSDIAEPGLYYHFATGGLYRIPSTALDREHHPLMEIVYNGDNRVAKLTDDPRTQVSKARSLAEAAHLRVNF